MGLQRDGAVIVSQGLLDQHSAELYERFVLLAEKYQYRDLGRAVADALLYWVEAHEQSDTMRPPAVREASPDPPQEDAADGTIPSPPPDGANRT